MIVEPITQKGKMVKYPFLNQHNLNYLERKGGIDIDGLDASTAHETKETIIRNLF